MKNKITILYDNTDNYTNIEETKEFLFDSFSEERGWKTIDDIPENVIYEEIDAQDNLAWQDFYEQIYKILSHDTYLLTGTCGCWYGPAEGGKFIRSPHDLFKTISHLERIRFYDEDGHLKIWGYHHDGEDNYELKRLTRKGEQFAMRNYFSNDRRIHQAIMTNRAYSALPRLAERLNGVLL